MAALIFGQGGSGNTAIGANNSVGATGAPAPSFATELGFIAASTFLVGVSASNPLPVTRNFTDASIGVIGVLAPTPNAVAPWLGLP